jgi:hypothetical protein
VLLSLGAEFPDYVIYMITVALGFATTSHVGLSNGLRLGRYLGGFGIHQNDFQRRVLEHPVKALRVDKSDGQQGRMHSH